jgi:hypothetical protein
MDKANTATDHARGTRAEEPGSGLDRSGRSLIDKIDRAVLEAERGRKKLFSTPTRCLGVRRRVCMLSRCRYDIIRQLLCANSATRPAHQSLPIA